MFTDLLAVIFLLRLQKKAHFHTPRLQHIQQFIPVVYNELFTLYNILILETSTIHMSMTFDFCKIIILVLVVMVLVPSCAYF